uniref:Uncharacterized protein MANES_04G137300 n=1 Tax=Rhizophora mucronata TaxID=61149 RepID=A0A2P2JED1_RHIMU
MQQTTSTKINIPKVQPLKMSPTNRGKRQDEFNKIEQNFCLQQEWRMPSTYLAPLTHFLPRIF